MKKKFGRRVVVAFAALTITAFAGTFASADTITASTTTDVNLRTGGSLDNPVITVVDPYTEVTVLNSDDPSWFQVQLSDGTTGYIFSQYLNVYGAAPPAGEQISESYVTNEYVNLRSGRSTGTYVITVLDPGTGVTVTDKSNSEWYGVTLSNGQTGYLYSIYLDAYYAPPTPPPTENPTPPPAGEQISESYVTNEYVNLRSGRSTDTYVITVLDPGTGVTVTDKSNSEWYGVTLSNGQTGYLYSIYLNPVYTPPAPPPTENPTPPPAGEQISESYVTNEYVNLRSGRSTDTYVITVLDPGTGVTVTDKSNSEWYGVTLSNGQTGYLYSIYLNPAYAPPPTTPPTGDELSESYITTEYVNLRTGRGTDTSVITVVNLGTSLTVTDKSDPSWYGVMLKDGTRGYMSSQYLRFHQTSNPNANIEYLKTINAENYSTLVETAKAEVGNNWTKYCNWWGLSGRVEWCSIFVTWCGNHAGLVPNVDYIQGYGANSDVGYPTDCGDGAGDHARFADRNGRYHSVYSGYVPKSGDLIFIDRSETVGNIGYLVMDHVAIIEKIVNGVVYTIDGNASASNDDTDLVRHRQYNMWDIIVAGYGEMPAV